VVFFDRLSRAIVAGAGIAVVAQGAIFIMHILLGREFGPADYGVFSIAIGLATLGAQVVPLGWQTVVTRFIAQYSVEREWGLLRGAVLRSNQITLLNAIIASVIIYAISRWLELEDNLSAGVGFGALLLPFLAAKALQRRQLMGFHRPKVGIILDDAAAPLFMIAVIFTMGFHEPGPTIFIYTGFVVVVCIIGAIAVHREMPEQAHTSKAEFQTKVWMMIALPATLGLASRIVLNRIDLLMIGPMIGVYDVGLYSTAQRLSYVLLFMPMVIATVTSSMIAAAFYKNDMAEVRRIFVVSTGISVFAASLFIAVVLLFSDIVIRLTYGQNFTDASGLLQVLAVGQFIQATGGLIPSMMLMTGQEKMFSYTITAIMVLNIVGNFFTIPIYGAMGAALVTVICTVILNVWQFFIMNRHLHIFARNAVA